MQYILKPAPEIFIKSHRVRLKMTQQLQSNLVKNFKFHGIDASCIAYFAQVKLSLNNPAQQAKFETVLENTPGVGDIHQVKEVNYTSDEDIYQYIAAVWAPKIIGQSFAVRCKCIRSGHLSSMEFARYIGGKLNQNHPNGGVDLSNPQQLIYFELHRDLLILTIDKKKGVGGFPIGSQGKCLSLLSGGFDSAVASYLTMRRGIKTDFVFFNLGSSRQELEVKEIAYYLWQKYSAAHKIKFISVPFKPVVDEILQQVEHPQMGVVLKRQFLRAASQIANIHNSQCLATGEALAQVASQTLPNLSLIDEVSSHLVLRPLITFQKNEIIDIAREIGTEEFSAKILEYCAVISKRPTTHARAAKIDQQEAKLDDRVLKQAVLNAQVFSIEKLADLRHVKSNVRVVDCLLANEDAANAVVIDIRHPFDIEDKPLLAANDKLAAGIEIIKIAFYDLPQQAPSLATDKNYYLYCDQGVMSRLHAEHLHQDGRANFHVLKF